MAVCLMRPVQGWQRNPLDLWKHVLRVAAHAWWKRTESSWRRLWLLPCHASRRCAAFVQGGGARVWQQQRQLCRQLRRPPPAARGVGRVTWQGGAAGQPALACRVGGRGRLGLPTGTPLLSE